MYDAPGVGLAAPQVGLPFQLVVIEDKREYMQDIPPEVLKERERQPVPFHVIVNPTITSYEGGRLHSLRGASVSTALLHWCGDRA
jgi:peptide deformylase